MVVLDLGGRGHHRLARGLRLLLEPLQDRRMALAAKGAQYEAPGVGLPVSGARLFAPFPTRGIVAFGLDLVASGCPFATKQNKL